MMLMMLADLQRGNSSAGGIRVGKYIMCLFTGQPHMDVHRFPTDVDKGIMRPTHNHSWEWQVANTIRERVVSAA